VHFQLVTPKVILALFASMVHNAPMRTSITLDEDVYQQATLYAKGRGVTLSAAVSEMARKGVEAMRSTAPSPRLKRAPNGLLLFGEKGRAITSEMVKAALEEDDF
jgi:hypothetical protein